MSEFNPLPRQVVDHFIVELAHYGIQLSHAAERELLVRVAKASAGRTLQADLIKRAVGNTEILAARIATTFLAVRRGPSEQLEMSAIDIQAKGLCPGFWPFC
jgi:hypothetical protein